MAARPHGPSRARREREETLAALAVALPPEADVVVVGGGAAGLVAAIRAAETGARCVALERAAGLGRTILATGGGRCNLANESLSPSRYNDPAFVGAVSGGRMLDDVLALFDGCGLALTREDGRLYPASLSAASVRDVLLARARRAGVVACCCREACEVRRAGDWWHVGTRDAQGRPGGIDARAVVVATGGGRQGGQGVAGLRLNAHPWTPVLAPLAAHGLPFEALDGQRVRARGRLLRQGAQVADERGEWLFRPYGLSGIAAFDLSRAALPGDELELDLVPDLDQAAVRRLRGRAGSFAGMVAPCVAAALLPSPDADPKHVRCTVDGVAHPELAQVARGGLATSGFEAATLEARALPGVFACGEALDVDGPCGGYNLAWAWESGMVAGAAAARRALGDGATSREARR